VLLRLHSQYVKVAAPGSNQRILVDPIVQTVRLFHSMNDALHIVFRNCPSAFVVDEQTLTALWELSMEIWWFLNLIVKVILVFILVGLDYDVFVASLGGFHGMLADRNNRPTLILLKALSHCLTDFFIFDSLFRTALVIVYYQSIKSRVRSLSQPIETVHLVYFKVSWFRFIMLCPSFLLEMILLEPQMDICFVDLLLSLP